MLSRTMKPATAALTLAACLSICFQPSMLFGQEATTTTVTVDAAVRDVATRDAEQPVDAPQGAAGVAVQATVKVEAKAATVTVLSEVKPAAAIKNAIEKRKEKKVAEQKVVVDEAPRDAAFRDPEAEAEAKPAEAAADFEFADAVNVDPFQQQFNRQFRILLKGEVYFINHTCQTTSEQRQQLKGASEEVLKKVVAKFVALQKKMNQGGFDWNSPTPEPRRQIQEGLLAEAKHLLSADQVALYELEVTKRLENRKQTCILNVVSRLDDELILTAEQRTKLTEELTARWKGAETQQMEIFLYGEHYFPNVPDQFVTGILNPKQKEVWRGIARNNNIFFGIGYIGNIPIDDNAWGDEAAAAKPENENKANEAKKQENE